MGLLLVKTQGRWSEQKPALTPTQQSLTHTSRTETLSTASLLNLFDGDDIKL